MKQKRNRKQSFLACKTGNQYMRISSSIEEGEGTNHCKTKNYNYNDKVYNDEIPLSIYRAWIQRAFVEHGYKIQHDKRKEEGQQGSQKLLSVYVCFYHF